jgi:hypothetical protein
VKKIVVIGTGFGDPDGYNIEIAYKPWLYK